MAKMTNATTELASVTATVHSLLEVDLGDGGPGSPQNSIVEEIAGLRLRRRCKLDAPQGVRGRNSDNSLIKQRLGWEPEISLEDGLEKTYAWMYEEIAGRSARERQLVSAKAGV